MSLNAYGHLVIPFLLAAAGACAETGVPGSDPVDMDPNVPGASDLPDLPSRARADWTIFVYGHADHNLTPSLVEDLGEMAAARLSSRVHVVVMADWNGGTQGFKPGIEWLEVQGNGAKASVIASDPEADLDDPAVLTAAITRAFRAYPADRYGLVVWDHGGAWRAGIGGDTQDGTRADARGMSVVEVRQAIARGLADAGLGGDRALGFLAFDTCLMAGVEVISELASLAEVYIANAELDYGPGWDYAATLGWLAAHPTATPRELAVAETAAWEAQHLAGAQIEELLRAHVAIDTRTWMTFEETFKFFVDTWRSAAAGPGASLASSAFESLPGYHIGDFRDLEQLPELRDVGMFLSRVKGREAPVVSGAAAAALMWLDKSIIARSMGSLRDGQRGVHIALPALSSAGADLTSYRAQAPRFSDDTGWDDGLAALAALSDGAGPRFTREIDPGPEVVIEVRTDAVDAAQIELGLLVQRAGAWVHVGNLGLARPIPGRTESFYWTPGTFSLPAPGGRRQLTGWQMFGGLRTGALDGGPRFVGIAGRVEDGQHDVYAATLLLDRDTVEIPMVVVFASGYSAVMKIEELAGQTFTPMFLREDQRAWVDGETISIGTGGIDVAWEDLPDGDVKIETRVWDSFGDVSLSSDTVNVHGW